jgi:diguanylate cyclase (GGDEF)-like protein/PAS domain S-box-containing protein
VRIPTEISQPDRSRGRRAFGVLWLLGGLAYLAFVGVVVSGAGSADLRAALIALSGAAAASAAALRAFSDRRSAPAWVFLGVALGSSVWSTLLYAFADSTAFEFPSIADVGLFVFYPAVLMAAVLVVKEELEGLPRVLWLDTAVAGTTVAALVVTWLLTLHKASGAAGEAAAGQLLYVIGDLIVLGFLGGVALLTRGRMGPTLISLALGMALLSTGDIAFVIGLTHGAGEPGLLSTLIWPTGSLALATAPWRRRVRRRAPIADRPLLVAIPVAAACVALPTVLGFWTPHREAPELLAGCVLVLVIARLCLSLIENGSPLRHVRKEASFTSAITNSLGEGVFAVGTCGDTTWMNAVCVRLLGYTLADLAGEEIHAVLHRDRPCEPDCALRAALRGPGAAQTVEEDVFVRADGAPLPVTFTAAPIESDDAVAGAVVVFADITARQSAQEQLRCRAVQQAAVADLGERALEGKPVEALLGIARRAVMDVMDVTAVEMVRHGESVTPPDDTAIDTLIQAGEGAHGILRTSLAPHARVTTDDRHFLQSIANVLADAIERSVTEERVRHRALHDPLTGMPNRALFPERLRAALTRADRDPRLAAVLFLDVDDFKHINDSLGHAAGDELLIALGRRFDDVVRPSDTLARLGGDEFALVCNVDDASGAVAIADRLREALTAPFQLCGEEHFVRASIGIAYAETSAVSPDALMRDADAAMFLAKRQRQPYATFDDGMRLRAADRLRLVNDLHRALDRRELEVHYQPLVRLGDRRIVGAEALGGAPFPATRTSS